MTARDLAVAPAGPFVPFAADRHPLLRQIGIVLAGSLFLAVCSWISVPMIPVPITMQTFGFIVVGALCGSRLAFVTSLVYLAQGALGAPVFAGGAAGLHHLVGPTGGYLLSFPIAAAFVGALAERGWTRGLVASFTVMTAAHVVILGLGAAYLSTFVGLERAIAAGVLPFIVGSFIKAGLAAALLEAGARWRNKRG